MSYVDLGSRRQAEKANPKSIVGELEFLEATVVIKGQLRTIGMLLAGVLLTCLALVGCSDDSQWKPPGEFVSRARLVGEVQSLAHVVFLYGPYPVSKNSIRRASEEIELLVAEAERLGMQENTGGEPAYYYGSVAQDLRRSLAINYYRIYILDSEFGDEKEAANNRASALSFLNESNPIWGEDELRSFVLSSRERQWTSCCED